MRLFITGAGGFLGSRLYSFYRDRFEVRAPGRREFDFTKKKDVRDIFSDFRPDVVIHAGAVSDVTACRENPALSMTVNVEGTRLLAENCERFGARMVYCSSDQVYFREKAGDESVEEFLAPNREESKVNPIPVYGQHKRLAEQLCIEAHPDSVILRLSWMYDSLTVEELERGRRNLATMLADALSCSESLPFSESDYRGVTDVSQVVRNVEPAWELPGGIYNFGSGNDGNMYDTVRRVLQQTGGEDLCRKAAAGELRNLTMDTQKLNAAGIRFTDTAAGLKGWLSTHVYKRLS